MFIPFLSYINWIIHTNKAIELLNKSFQIGKNCTIIYYVFFRKIYIALATTNVALVTEERNSSLIHIIIIFHSVWISTVLC